MNEFTVQKKVTHQGRHSKLKGNVNIKRREEVRIVACFMLNSKCAVRVILPSPEINKCGGNVGFPALYFQL